MDIIHGISSLIPRSIVIRVKYFKQYLYRKKTGRFLIETNYKYRKISKPKTHVFFGYYDISPFNEMTDEIIYNNLVVKENKLHLMKSSLSTNEEIEIAETRAWNWQQGCRLRWMPNNNREIVFNDFDGKGYLARIVNVDSGAERKIIAPLYDISPDGNYGITIDFERLGIKRPGYGYVCRPYNEDEHDLKNEKIELIDLRLNTRETILTYEQISQLQGCHTAEFKDNYINHIAFSPSGKKILFFWLTVGKDLHKAYLLVHNFETKETKLLENREKVSHYVWQDENHIICTAIDDMIKSHYYRYNVCTGMRETLSPDILKRDGHPSIFSEDILLTDTYPDLDGYQNLYLVNIKNSVKTQVLSIYSNCMVEGEKRTDLHPRLNHDNTIICYDANVGKYRELFFVNLK